MTDILDAFAGIIGATQVLTGADAARYGIEPTGHYPSMPRAVLRPASTTEVSEILKLAHREGIAIVPAGGRTGLTGATKAEGAVMLSLERMNRIRDLNPVARVVRAEAGVIISTLHDRAADHGLDFPLWFGARGSATVGGVLSTNAGGSNVVRYGNTRALCLGIEAVLADGRVLNLMSALHKDNSGYDLRDLLIGAEGTLAVITAATLKLVPAAKARATAVLGMQSLDAALGLLNRLQEATGGLVEAFEYMPEVYQRRLRARRPDLGSNLPDIHPVSILVELGATAPRDTTPNPDGGVPLQELLMAALEPAMEDGTVSDAILATSEEQRRAIWERREVAAEITFGPEPFIDTDIALPLDKVAAFLTRIEPELQRLDPGAGNVVIGHLGDGNLHYSALPTRDDPALYAAVVEAVEGIVADLGGSFSAEHGIGLMKQPSMARRKDPVALEVMRAIKAALDPKNILNPGKTLPPKG
ncbi:MAG: FAD-binding oxidoreductase [Proteobacteria bacterium]|nr:FAD-binding oxidoreductase [Pseudomonadota bacterium]